MRRRYNRELYQNRVEKIRRTIPDACVGIDVIVGHPGETEERFKDSYQFLIDLPFSYLHVFSYSERPNTYALTLDDKVHHAERARRSEMLRNLSVRKRRLFYESQIGKTIEVLFESEIDDGIIKGFSDNYVRVGLHADEALINKLIPVRLVEMRNGFVNGEVFVNEKY